MKERYSESEILKEIAAYVRSTYEQHYAGKRKDIQLIDLFDSLDLAPAYCRTNAIKYLGRYGKKNGKNKIDLLKAIHCIMLEIHFEYYADEEEEENKDE